ncbi:hypothetical protein CP556_24995 [Natrinema sp. CBA1119]|nr:hypothetical protein CP556_24995 [Natrinema sp. CBA1119]
MRTRTVTLEIPVPQLTREHGLWALVAVATAADALTTQVGLEAGLVESNPLARGALAHGLSGFLAMKAGAVGVGLAVRPLLERDHRSIIPVCLAVPWFGAAAINMYALAQIGVLA